MKTRLLSKRDRVNAAESPGHPVSTTVGARCEFKVILDKGTLEDESVEIVMDVFVSDDGTIWKPFHSMGFRGRRLAEHEANEVPSYGRPAKWFKGKQVRVRLTPNKRMNVGVEFEDRMRVQ